MSPTLQCHYRHRSVTVLVLDYYQPFIQFLQIPLRLFQWKLISDDLDKTLISVVIILYHLVTRSGFLNVHLFVFPFQTRNRFEGARSEVYELMKRIREAPQEYRQTSPISCEGYLYVQEKRKII